MVRAALPHQRAQGGGRIIQISTYGGQAALPGGSLYHASKWGIEGFIDAVGQEVATFNIGVTIVPAARARISGMAAPNSVLGWTPFHKEHIEPGLHVPFVTKKIGNGRFLSEREVYAIEVTGPSPRNCRSRAGTNRSAIPRWPTASSTAWCITPIVWRCAAIPCVRIAGNRLHSDSRRGKRSAAC